MTTQSPPRAAPPTRDAFAHFAQVPTRWADNDVYGHVNNVVYYAYFDTVVNSYLLDQGALSIEASPVIGVVVETGCRYHASVAYPQVLDIGLSVTHIGNSSVRYALGVFASGAPQAAASGHFVHVYVDRDTRKPVAIPAALRFGVQRLFRAA